MTKVNFLNSTTFEVVARDGELFTFKTFAPVHYTKQKSIMLALAQSFENNFQDDKVSMVYWALMEMLRNESFGFAYESSDRSKDRERIGAKIRALRESKQMEAKQLATLAGIDASNLCRIEQGRYSAGLDILTKISVALGVKVDLV